MKFSENQIKLFRNLSIVSGIFTMVIAFTMIMSLIQLKTSDPLESPALTAVKDMFDKDPDNADKAEYVRSLDLIARKAYFTARWQLETGSYLLVAGAVLFVFFQWLVTSGDKPARSKLPPRPELADEKKRNQKYLLISASAVFLLAIISSFVLRPLLPAPGEVASRAEKAKTGKVADKIPLPGNVNFPSFRGEGSRGIAGGEGYPTEWDGNSGKNIKWKVPVPKFGKSSPIIWDGKIFLTGAEGNIFEVYCFDKNTGNILWTGSGSDFPGAAEKTPETEAEAGGMAVCTPAVNKDAVCAIFSNGNLVAYTHDGKFLWGTNLGVPEHTYGYSSSLIIYEDILIVQYDSDKRLSVIGFDVKTGKQLWETSRRGRPVNSSPALGYFNGIPQVIINGSPEVTAFNATNGKELWSIQGVVNDVAVSPAINNQFVYVSSNYEALLAIKPGPGPSVAWSDNTYTPDVSSPAATDEFLFVSDGTGAIVCYKADTKEILWENYFNSSFYASPIVAGGMVYFLDRDGVMHVVKASATYELVSESPIGEATDSTPAFSEKKIYIRGEKNLYCISTD
ncbi:MAG: PQQ-binding-like beta-propeller repeat protein [Bacteroidales bacterium]